MQLGLVAAQQLGSQIAVEPEVSTTSFMPAKGPLATTPACAVSNASLIAACLDR